MIGLATRALVRLVFVVFAVFTALYIVNFIVWSMVWGGTDRRGKCALLPEESEFLAVDACAIVPGVSRETLLTTYLPRATNLLSQGELDVEQGWRPARDKRSSVRSATQFAHHPIFSVFLDSHGEGPVYSVRPKFTVEETGLRVPWEFDCTTWTKDHDYHLSVPSRWIRCNLQRAAWESQLMYIAPKFPEIDEEYIEVVAVYGAVLTAARGSTLAVCEMGARWGTWGSRAAAFARMVRPDIAKISLLYYEPRVEFQRGLKRVHEENGLGDYEIHKEADESTFRHWAGKHQHIDILDMDIQGAEAKLWPQIADVVRQKVKRLIIGTHGCAIHREIRATVRDIWGWDLQHEYGCDANISCVQARMRVRPADWSAMINDGCFVRDPHFGPIGFWDGELIFDNPKFNGQKDRSRCMIQLPLRTTWPSSKAFS